MRRFYALMALLLALAVGLGGCRLGDREAEERTVSVNIRGNKKMNGVPLDRFIEICQKMNREHSLELTESAD